MADELISILSMEEKLKDYYKFVFPFETIYKWLSQSQDSFINKFNKREFSVTLANDIYIRYLSFENADEFKSEIVRFCPEKIDIGAVFNYKPKDHPTLISGALKAQEREFVIDIDLTDYDDVRTCCKDAIICQKCWKLVAIAMEIVHSILTEDFGFENIMWVFSGRRGVHCWVSDRKACELAPAARSAIVDYITLVKGGAHKNKKVFLNSPLHPSIERSKRILIDKFRDYFYEQGFFNTVEQVDKILSLLPLADDHRDISKNVLKDLLLNSDYTEQDKWKYIIQALNITSKDNDKENLPLYDLIFQYMYPRLDINVSKTLNHLLKSPFCVHPKTGQICIPINIEDAYNFDPLNAPKLDEIVLQIKTQQYNSNYNSNKDNNNPSNNNDDDSCDVLEKNLIEDCQWKQYLNTFDRHVEKLLLSLKVDS